MALYSVEALRDGYLDLWSRMEIRGECVAQATTAAKKVLRGKDVYQRIEKRTGVPWFVVGVMHYRESDCNFKTYFGNGQSLNKVTTMVPKGRGPWKSFEDGAFDALVTVENLDDVKEWGPEYVAYALEKFNGFGYRNPKRAIPSPYLWAGTNIQKRGKWFEEIKNGVYRKWYDPNVMDPQLGGMVVLKRVMELDDEAQFRTSKPQKRVDPAPADAPPPLSTRADDMESDVSTKPDKKTWLGTITTYLGGNGGMLTIIGDKLSDPWVLAGALFVAAVGGVGVIMILRGAIDLKNMNLHLSQDDRS